jgi:hypothetical protein
MTITNIKDSIVKENYPNMPEYTRESIDRFVEKGIPGGHFVMAVMENNLTSAVCQADNNNIRGIVDTVKYVYNVCPSGCHGSAVKVREWMHKKSL